MVNNKSKKKSTSGGYSSGTESRSAAGGGSKSTQNSRRENSLNTSATTKDSQFSLANSTNDATQKPLSDANRERESCRETSREGNKESAPNVSKEAALNRDTNKPKRDSFKESKETKEVDKSMQKGPRDMEKQTSKDTSRDADKQTTKDRREPIRDVEKQKERDNPELRANGPAPMQRDMARMEERPPLRLEMNGTATNFEKEKAKMENGRIRYDEMRKMANMKDFYRSDLRIASPHSPRPYTHLCDVESQTESSMNSLNFDPIISFVEQPRCEQVESMCEMVQLLDAADLRLLGSCVEAASRVNSTRLKQFEIRANSELPLYAFPNPECYYTDNRGHFEQGETIVPIFTVLDSIYLIIALMSSTNRKSAHQIVEYLDKLLTMRHVVLERMEGTTLDKYKVIELYARIVGACVHHPAFTADQRLRFREFREVLRSEREQISKKLESEQKPPIYVDANVTPEPDRTFVRCTPVPCRPIRRDPPVFIVKFSAQPLDDDSFVIQIFWSDNDATSTNRTREELSKLHHQLLDAFGSEKKNDTSSEPSSSNFTDDTTSQSEGTEPGQKRILPYFKKNGTPSEIVQYIEDLSDLPARMMLSNVIFSEFHATRLKTADLHTSIERPGSSSARTPPVRRHTTQLQATPNWAMLQQPLAYGAAAQNSPMNAIQVVEPSCTNCAGPHAFQHCEKPAPMERTRFAGDFKLKYAPEEVEAPPQPSNDVNAVDRSTFNGSSRAQTAHALPPNVRRSTWPASNSSYR